MYSIPAIHDVRAERLTLTGGVQGVGLRPRIARLAHELRLTGIVRNAMRGVVVELEGPAASLDTFALNCRELLPDPARLASLDREPIVPAGHRNFSIVQSEGGGRPQTAIPLDLKICKLCLVEVFNPSNRRFRYAFTSCTDCGSRYSILRSMPYDRERTSMDRFPMCATCRAEYSEAGDRRFHSQTNCCSDCGPRVWFSKHGTIDSSQEAVSSAAATVLRGEILAVKGLGGYQLVCDATNEAAVRKLRARKQRLTRPLAVMVLSLEQATSLAILSTRERQAIDCSAGPIVLLRASRNSPLADSVHPELNTLGVMLPTTALHALLAELCRVPLVVTSGNLEGEPLVHELETAETRLSTIADAYLHHDREIVRAIDDSVVRCMNDRMVTIRAARGLAPMVVELAADVSLLAVGGQQKVSISLSNGYQAVLGPHLGDLATVAGREHFEQHVSSCQMLYSCNPNAIAHDLHPDYFSTRWSIGRSNTLCAAQHHHAHIVAGMVEHGWLDKMVLGIAFDGTGWGESGVVFGGEILLASALKYDRVGSLRPFPLPGGEVAIHEPYRIAIALLHAALGDDLDKAIEQCGLKVPSQALEQVLVAQHRFSPLTTSAGRLFDGVATIALGDVRPNYEGELAMRWESLCDPDESQVYPFLINVSHPAEIDWRPMVQALYWDRSHNVPSSAMAMRFHRGLAQAIGAIVDHFPNFPVVLSGGVFQNRLLVELLDSILAAKSRSIGWCAKIPPNDGGLSVGQLAIAASRYTPRYGQRHK